MKQNLNERFSLHLFTKNTLLTAVCCFLFVAAGAQCPPPSTAAHHRVQKGESLWRISKKYGLTVAQLAALNNMPENAMLDVCQEILVRPATQPERPAEMTQKGEPQETHVIQAGETIGAIAREYGYTEERFRSFNGLRSDEPAWPGLVLKTSDCVCPSTSTTTTTTTVTAPVSKWRSSGQADYDPGDVATTDRPATTTTTTTAPTGQPSGGAIYEDPYGIDTGRRTSFDTEPAPVTTTPRTERPRNTPLSTTRTSNDGFQPADEQVLGGSSTTTDRNGSTGTTTSPRLLLTASDAPYMDAEEIAMVNEINLVRSNPRGYVTYIEAYKERVRSGQAFGSVATCDELIGELRSLQPLRILQPTECIYRAAKKHGQDQRPTGSTDHVGTDGSYPWDRVRRECPDLRDGNENLVGGPANIRDAVILLLVDDGIPNRGHRRTMLDKDWQYVACYKIGTVGNMPNNWVQKYGK